MKVLNLRGVNDIRLEERDIPQIKRNEVLLQIKACGICSSDEDRIFKTGTYHFPTVPGHEFAGKIVAVGADVDKSILNRKASVFPLLPCFKCRSCEIKEYATCADYKYFGSRNDGGFAEYLAVPEWNLNIIDDSVDYTVAALSEPAAVAHHALNMVNIQQNDTIVIVGTGTIAILIAEMCKYIGAKPLIVARRSESALYVNSFGVKAIETKDVDAYTNGEQIPVVFEVVGSNEAMETAINCVSPNGTVVAVGNPKGNFTLKRDVYWKLLRRQITLKGTWNSSYKAKNDDWRIVAKMMRTHDIPFEKLVSETFSLEEFEEAFAHFRDKKTPKSRIMFVMNGEDQL